MFRVYTEDTGSDVAEDIAAEYLDGFTLIRGIGCWRGTFEQSLVFEIDTSDSELVFKFAKALKSALDQEAVLVVNQPSTSVLV